MQYTLHGTLSKRLRNAAVTFATTLGVFGLGIGIVYAAVTLTSNSITSDTGLTLTSADGEDITIDSGGNILLQDTARFNDVDLSRIAENVLGLASGDSFRLPSDGQLQFSSDVLLSRGGAANLQFVGAHTVSTSAGDLTLNPGGNVHFGGNTLTNIQAATYTSGERLGVSSATFVVCASDAQSTKRCDYVADGTDDDVEIQAAIDALPAAGGRILLSEGTFNVGASLNNGSAEALILEGQGSFGAEKTTDGVTIIQLATNANVDGIVASDTTERVLYLRHLVLDGNKANNTSGNGILWNYLNLHLFDVQVRNWSEDGIKGTVNLLHMTALYFYIESNDGTGISAGRSAGASNDGRVQGIYLERPNWVHANGGNGVWLTGADMGGTGTDSIINLYTETNGAGDGGGGNDALGAGLSGFTSSLITIWAKGNNGPGLALFGATQGSKVVVNAHNNANTAASPTFAGNVYVSTVTGPVDIDVHVDSDGAGTSDGLWFNDNATGNDNIHITGQIKADRHAINITNTAVNNFDPNNILFSDMNLEALTGNILNFTPPAGLKFRNNRGYVTENSGTATVTNGTTSVSVTHGLSNTPSAEDCSVTPTNALGSATTFWTSGFGASNYTINVDVDPLADTATFSWTCAIY